MDSHSNSDYSHMDHNLGSYFQDFSYYIPSSWKQKFSVTGHSSTTIKEEKDLILATAFDELEIYPGET